MPLKCGLGAMLATARLNAPGLDGGEPMIRRLDKVLLYSDPRRSDLATVFNAEIEDRARM
jgi:hypothetical protein